MVAKGRTASQIDAALAASTTFAERKPDIRTIQRRVVERAKADSSGKWELDEEGSGDAAVLETLAEVIRQTRGQVASFTNGEAAWIFRLAGLAQDMGPWLRFLVARLLVARQARDADSNDLQAYLAFAPWRSARHWNGYRDAIFDGIRPAEPWLLDLTFAARIEPASERPPNLPVPELGDNSAAAAKALHEAIKLLQQRGAVTEAWDAAFELVNNRWPYQEEETPR